MVTQFFGRSTDDEDEGEVLETEGEESQIGEVEETDDGGAIIKMSEETPEQYKEFYGNIAEDISDVDRSTLCTYLLECIQRDKKSREQRDKQYEEAIKRTGLGKEAPGGADFEGASKAVHPMLTQACVDFEARAIRELLPPNGPVKSFVPGEEPSQDRMKKADRKKDYMNWQFLEQMPEFRHELEQLLTQLPLGGSQFLRIIYDAKFKRPVPTFWPSDDVYIPYAASSFWTAERATFAEPITKFEFDQRVKEGMYIDLHHEVITASLPEETKAQQATDKVQGKTPGEAYNEDGLRTVYEVMIYHDFEDDKEVEGVAPYRVAIDQPERKIVAIYRNWEKEDEAKESMFWMIEFPFVPWRGAYSIGLGQMIGSLSGTATGALRALLDSAHINNLPTLIRLKGANFSGQSKELNVAEITEIEGGIGGDQDIRKLLMAVPFNPPSAVLLQLLGFVTDAGQSVVRTTFEKLSEQRTDMPVGTTLALIEEGMKVMSAIHLRLYHSMTQVIKVLHRINRMYLTDEQVKNDIGEVLAKRSDFQLPLDVIPTADPEIFSDVQRLAQLQIVADRAQAMPDLYNRRKLEERLLERSKIPNPEELLLPEPSGEEQNAVNENAAMTLQQPVTAFPEQDHLAHLQVHLDYMMSPIFGSNPLIAPAFMPMCLEHIKEHISLWYVNAAFDILKNSTQYDDEQIADVLKLRDSETRQELDRTLAAASQKIIPAGQEVFGSIPDIVQQAMQMLQQMQPPPQIPIDPNVQMQVEQRKEESERKAQAEQMKLGQKAQEAQQKRELEFTKLSAKEQAEQIRIADNAARQARELAARLKELQVKESGEDTRSEADRLSKEKMNMEDNTTAMTIAAAEIESGEKVGLETGTGINPNP